MVHRLGGGGAGAGLGQGRRPGSWQLVHRSPYRERESTGQGPAPGLQAPTQQY